MTPPEAIQQNILFFIFSYFTIVLVSIADTISGPLWQRGLPSPTGVMEGGD